MKYLSGVVRFRAASALLYFFLFSLLTSSAANVGSVVPVVGQPIDLAHDPARGLVYLANFTENRVDIYSVGGRSLVGSIPTGQGPSGLAMSPDGNTLYVANSQSLSISAINLTSQQEATRYPVATAPDAVAVGSDGLVVILGPAGLLRLNPITGTITPLPVSVPPVPAGLPTITPTPAPSGFHAALVTSPSGTTIIGLSSNRLFVYDVASGTVLRARNVTGLPAVLAVAPDASRFMGGPFLFDTQTLAILGRAGTPGPTVTGGAVFSVDGNSVYATFSSQPAINPLNTNSPQNPGGARLPGSTTGGTGGLAATLGVLQVMRATSLTPVLGLRLPAAINPKIIASADGQNLFALSTSSLVVIPIGQLSQLPVIGVSTSSVVLSMNQVVCNPNPGTVQVQINNLGAGRLTFTAVPASSTTPVIIAQRSGLAPTTLQITYDARSVTTQGSVQVAVVLVSPEAVNIEPAIVVSLNFTSGNQRGTIIPMSGVAADVQMDQARQRLYIANYTQDQIEVFSLATQSFLPPIRVGNRPRSIGLANASTLVVANSGAEYISVVDLDQLQEVQQIPMGPIPVNATAIFPRYIAVSSNAILFTAIPLPANLGAAPGTGSIWQLNLLTGTAAPRLNLGANATNIIQGQSRLISPASGNSIVIFENNGTLVLYDPISDLFPVTRTAAVTGFRGTVSAAADGSFFVLDDSLFNSVLGFQGTLVPAGGTGTAANLTFGVTAAGNNAVRVNPAATGSVQSLALINLANLQTNQQVSLPEAVMDISPVATLPATPTAKIWPPNVVAQELGVNGQTQLLPRGMVMDSASNVYLLTESGLSIVSLTAQQPRPPTFSVGGVVNAASFTAPVSPGSLISIFGTNLSSGGAASSLPLPTSLGGSCVTVNGTVIPLLYASPTQINAQLPPNLAAGRVTLAVQSSALGLVSPGVQVQVNAAAPGVFTLNYNGETRAELFHADNFSLVTPDNPAHRDEFLVLYATGLGAVSPTVPAGQAAGSSPPSVTTQGVGVVIGGHDMDVRFAGLAPGFVGAYQINLYVPGTRLIGDHLPVVVTVGGASSTLSAAPLTTIH